MRDQTPQPWEPPIDGWSVRVERFGNLIVSIEERSLSGKDEITDADAETILHCARHLLSFVGDPVDAARAADAETIRQQAQQIAALSEALERVNRRLIAFLAGDGQGLAYEAHDIARKALGKAQ